MLKKSLLLTTLLFAIFIFYNFTFSQNLVLKKFTKDTLPMVAEEATNKPINIISTFSALTFETGLENEYFQFDSINRKGSLYIETRVSEIIADKKKRIPLNIAVVIDRSGSMQGEKMEFARKAAKDIIDKLAIEDFISIVAYDDEVEIILPSVHPLKKNEIKSKIDEIKPGGSTNLWGGSELGYYQVMKKSNPQFINRVLLISDGLVNAGLTSARAIKMNVRRFKDENGITLSTFGVGLDYNEVLMTDMAETGAGNYYFIDSAHKMTAMFEKELDDLLNVAAQNVELTIKLPKGIKIEKVFPTGSEVKENEMLIKYRDLFENETKAVLLNFKIDDGITTELKFISSMRFTDPVSAQIKILTSINRLKPINDRRIYLTRFNSWVIKQKILFIANENMEKAMSQADEGKYDEALKLIAINKDLLKANIGYMSNNKPLKQMDSVNTAYANELIFIKNKSREEVKRLQKVNRSQTYKIRNKKQ